MNSNHQEFDACILSAISKVKSGFQTFCQGRPGDWKFFMVLILLLTLRESMASGTWTPLNNAPATGVNCAMLLGDGTVLTYDGSSDCNRLTPDIHGSYINGTWTRLASMNNSRLFFASVLLTNGNVFVAGGE